MITGLVIISCTGFEELNDPSEFAAYSIEMSEVSVPRNTLEIPLAAKLDIGKSTKGDALFMLSKNSNMSNADKIDATRNGSSVVSKQVLKDYGQTYYVKALFLNSINAMESSVVSFTLLPFNEYVTVDAPAPTDITPSSLTISSTAKCAFGVNLDYFGFELGDSVDPFHAISSISAKKNGDEYRGSFSSLEPGRTYYVRAFTCEGEETAYSTITEISTQSELPSLRTPSISEATTNSAKVLSGLLSDGGAKISEMGVVYSLTKSPTIASTKIKASTTSIGDFTIDISNLEPGKTYYVRAYATNTVGTAYSSEASFVTNIDVAKLTTANVTGVTDNSAVCGGSITDNGGSLVTARGVVWSTVQNPTVSLSTKTVNGSGDGQFTSNITGLKPATKYYVRAYATTLAGTAYGNEVSFTTNATVPTVSTQAITNITATSATSGGNVTNNGGSAITARGVVWSTSKNPTTDLPTKTTNGSGTGAFTSSITGLKAGITYYVRAYATNAIGTSYGEELTFVSGIAQPTVTTETVVNITSNSASCGGNVVEDGGSTVTARGLVWSTSENPTINLSTKVVCGNGKGSFSGQLTSLEPGTVYYVRTYATNTAGTAYGEQRSFKTSTTIPEVRTISVTDVTSSSAKASGEVTVAGGLNVTSRGFVWSTKENPDISLKTKVECGSDLGVFNGAINDLQAGQTYYLRAYAINDEGVAYGDQVIFVTGAAMPTVFTSKVDNITGYGATCGGVVSSDGGSAVLSRGIVWDVNPSPTISLSTKTVDGNGVGSFSSSLTNLQPGKSYYVRAYASNTVGTAYGETLALTTAFVAPSVVTCGVSDVRQTTAKVSGRVESDGGDVTTRGIVYGTSKNPTIERDYVVNCGSGIGDYTAKLSGLQKATWYYARAFATNSVGTVYGEEVDFVTKSDSEGPDGSLTFMTEGSASISLNKVGSPNSIKIEYSLNGRPWESYTIGTSLSIVKGGWLSFRAGDGGNTRFNGSVETYYNFRISGDYVSASGDVMSLVDQDLATDTIPYNSFFCRLFYGCDKLISAPELSAVTLKTGCYMCMFEECSNLGTAPKLPATKLAKSCYSNMFKNCRNLQQAPELPAQELAEYCYQDMFENCTSLSQAPELPAQEMAEWCYNEMFYGCSSLTSAPLLNSTSLAKACYGNMFRDCTSLVTAPEVLPATELAWGCYLGMFYNTRINTAPALPALVLVDNCYSGMFYDCSNLSFIKMMATDISADRCLDSWTMRVPKLGTFVKNSSASWNVSGYNGIPSGWTVVYASE